MKDIDNPLKGHSWRVLAMLFVCIDFIIIIYETVHFILMYRSASSVDPVISSYGLALIDDHRLLSNIINEFMVRISISIIITSISIFCIIKKKYAIAAIINGIPLLILAIIFTLLAYAFSRG